MTVPDSSTPPRAAASAAPELDRGGSVHRGTANHRGMADRVRVLRVGGAGAGERADSVVVEEPLRIHVEHHGERLLLGSTMRTPGHDLELAAGLAVGEGVLSRRADVLSVSHCAIGGRGTLANEVTVTLADELTPDLSGLGRVRHPSSACGVCGRDDIDALLARVRRVSGGLRVTPAVLAGLPEAMRERQTLFRRTGGLHAAALATANGEILAVREDVGRHNAVDKVIGAALLQGLVGEVLVVSGRAGFEIVQKAAMAGIAVVAAVSAPTSLSVQVARECGLTLAGFVREGRLTVYSGADRLDETGIDDVAEAASW